MKRFKTALCITALIALQGGCGPREDVITGQVFIVTRGGQSVKLGMVAVSAMDLRRVEAEVRSWKRDLGLRDSAYRAEQWAADAEVDSAFSRISIAKSAIAALQGFPSALAEMPPWHGSESTRPLSHFREREARIARYRSEQQAPYVAQLAAAESLLESARAVLRRKSPMHDFTELLGRLPEPLATSQTDADGEFSLTIPHGRPIAIFARSSRDLPGGREEYKWLIRVPDEARAGQKLLLNNEKMTSMGSDISLVLTLD